MKRHFMATTDEKVGGIEDKEIRVDGLGSRYPLVQ